MTLAVEVFVEVLRVRLLRGVVGLAADDLTGIKNVWFVYSSNIAKNPHGGGFSGHFLKWIILL